MKNNVFVTVLKAELYLDISKPFAYKLVWQTNEKLKLEAEI